jgi:hypothetical protein
VKRLKTFGLAAVLALTLTAVLGASAASANEFKVSVAPASWSGSLTGKNHELSLNEMYFSCSKVAFSGETKTLSMTELTVTPELGSCVHINTGLTSWAINGCKYRFHPGANGSSVGTMDIVNCASPMTNQEAGCTHKIGNQMGLGPVTYKNVGTGESKTITVIANITNLTFTREGNCFGAPIGTFSNGKYTGEWSVKGATIPGGVQAGVEWYTPPPPPPSKFAAEEAPATLSGTGTNKVFGLGENGGLTCANGGVTYGGVATTVPTAAIVMTPSYSGCTISQNGINYNVTVATNGCKFEFVVASGTQNIVGSECATWPMTFSIPNCAFTVAAQSNAGAISFTNQGEGWERTVAMGRPTTSTLDFTATGTGCTKAGSFTNGEVRGTGAFSAKTSKGVAQGLWVE